MEIREIQEDLFVVELFPQTRAGWRWPAIPPLPLPLVPSPLTTSSTP